MGLKPGTCSFAVVAGSFKTLTDRDRSASSDCLTLLTVPVNFGGFVVTGGSSISGTHGLFPTSITMSFERELTPQLHEVDQGTI